MIITAADDGRYPVKSGFGTKYEILNSDVQQTYGEILSKWLFLVVDRNAKTTNIQSGHLDVLGNLAYTAAGVLMNSTTQ